MAKARGRVHPAVSRRSSPPMGCVKSKAVAEVSELEDPSGPIDDHVKAAANNRQESTSLHCTTEPTQPTLPRMDDAAEVAEPMACRGIADMDHVAEPGPVLSRSTTAEEDVGGFEQLSRHYEMEARRMRDRCCDDPPTPKANAFLCC